jgi:protein transport protein SEC61 subunit gamma-like protein
MEISKPDFKTDAIHEELVRKYWRVIKLARTPTREEFTKIAIVAAAGVLVVGMIGFAIFDFFNIESLFGF